MKQVILCAHRGLDDSAPENTMAAFDSALAKGMAIELDIQRTADDHLVVVHDPTVDRTTNGSGKIAAMSLAEVKALDAGSWYGSQFAGQRWLTLDEVSELVSSRRPVSPSIALDVHIGIPSASHRYHKYHIDIASVSHQYISLIHIRRCRRIDRCRSRWSPNH